MLAILTENDVTGFGSDSINMKVYFIVQRQFVNSHPVLSIFYSSAFASVFSRCGLLLEIVRRVSSANVVVLNIKTLGKSLIYKANNRGPSVET